MQSQNTQTERVMYNHEYGINLEGDYDVCAYFGGAS